MVATIIATVAYKQNSYLLSADAAVARKNGIEVRPYTSAVQLQRKSIANESPSGDDLSELRHLVTDKNELIRARAVSAVARFGRRDSKVECIAILKSRLQDESDMVRASALRGIWRIDPVEGKAVAQTTTTIGEADQEAKQTILASENK
ncbi:MAG: hypothetical protein ACOYON_02100 [Fimbriimonas sp.]